MKSYQTLYTLFTTLTQNSSSANQSLGQQLINDQHRYLLQKYFDNLQTAYMSTVGSQSLTLTGTLALAATSATLTASWSYPTGYSYVNFSNGNSRNVLFTNGSTAISWTVGLSATATTAITALGQQGYSIPGDISKIKDGTVSIGQLKFTPAPVLTQMDWDTINFLPYNSDIPQYYYIYNSLFNIFPIPSTTGNVITFNYKRRVPDLSYADYSTGTVGGTAGSTAIAGASTNWNSSGTYPLNVDLTYANIFIRITPPKGDGIWYQVRTFTSNTALTLVNPLVNAPAMVSGAAYTLGQFPLLQEDFHDMIVYGALMTYYTSVVDNKVKFAQFKSLYESRLSILEDYAGTRQINVDLGNAPNPVNPNLFIYATS